MASLRMLKELQSLAPWTWDKVSTPVTGFIKNAVHKCDKHPPGQKALHDFERPFAIVCDLVFRTFSCQVEQFQGWSKPPSSSKNEKKVRIS
eukprot:scaffold246013_cov44-Prasinocladus_malaysianus.AAC.2